MLCIRCSSWRDNRRLHFSLQPRLAKPSYLLHPHAALFWWLSVPAIIFLAPLDTPDILYETMSETKLIVSRTADIAQPSTKAGPALETF